MREQNWKDCKDNFVTFRNVKSRLIYGTLRERHPEFSIMIPTFRRADLLKMALDSALNQNGVSDYEVSVVDNDDEVDFETDVLMKRYCTEHDNLLYYRNEKNLGMCGNWNRCVELSRSEGFCILHDDDLLLPDYLKTIAPYARAIQYGAIGVFNQYYSHSGNREFPEFRASSDRGKQLIAKIRGKRLIPFQLLDSVRDMRPSPTACFYNRKACMQMGGFEFRKDGDGLTNDNLFFDVMSTKTPVYILAQVLALRGVSDNDSQKPDTAKMVIIGNYNLNQCIINEVTKNSKYYQSLNQKMAVGQLHSYISTYGVDLNVDELCSALKIEENYRRLSSRKLKMLKMLLWGSALLRKEPEDVKKARKSS